MIYMKQSNSILAHEQINLIFFFISKTDSKYFTFWLQQRAK